MRSISFQFCLRRSASGSACAFDDVEPVLVAGADPVDREVNTVALCEDAALSRLVNASFVKMQRVAGQETRAEQSRRRQAFPQTKRMQIRSVRCVMNDDAGCSCSSGAEDTIRTRRRATEGNR